MAQVQVLQPIPHPRPDFLLGSLLDVCAESPLQAIIRLAQECGPTDVMELPTGRVVVLSGFSLVDEVCDDRRFDKLVAGGVAMARTIAGDGLFTADTQDPNWVRRTASSSRASARRRCTATCR